MNGTRITTGDVIDGKYRVERLLGQGGMGFVVAAHHLALDQPVALKFLQPRLAADPDLVARFLREARASVKLKNPHVARVLDVGTRGGEPFIVMEYLEGRDLAEKLADECPLPVAEACDLILQTCAALVEAHALGMVHRDLKPANLFVTEGHDGGPHVKILDFGVSKMLHDDGARTGAAVTMGSPAYMAPEQMREAAGVDARADLWSLGVVLYEMVSGHLPHHAASVAELAVKVLGDDIQPLDEVADLPADFVAVVHRCLERTAARRPASVVELAGLLAPFASERGRHAAAGVAAFARARQRPRVVLPLPPPRETPELLAGSVAARRVRRSSAPPVPAELISTSDPTESMAPAPPRDVTLPPAEPRARRLLLVASTTVLILSLLGIVIAIAIR